MAEPSTQTIIRREHESRDQASPCADALNCGHEAAVPTTDYLAARTQAGAEAFDTDGLTPRQVRAIKRSRREYPGRARQIDQAFRLLRQWRRTG